MVDDYIPAFEPHKDYRGFVPAPTVYQSLIAKGFTPNAARGILGNLMYESGGGAKGGVYLDPPTDAGHYNWGTGDAAEGAAQWEGSRQRGLAPTLPSQVNKIWQELNSSGDDLFPRLQGARSPGEAADIVNISFERPQYPGASAAARRQYASTALGPVPALASIGGPNPPAAPLPVQRPFRPDTMASPQPYTNGPAPSPQRPYLPSTMNAAQPNTYTPPAQNNFDNAVQAYTASSGSSAPPAQAQSTPGNAIASLLGGLTSAFKAPQVQDKPDPQTLLSEQQALNGDFGTGQGTQPSNGMSIAQAILAGLPAPLVLNA